MSKKYGVISLKGKVAVVIGGASGMGRESATAMVNTGCKVVVGDLNKEGLDSLKAELGGSCEVMPTDGTNGQQIEALIKKAIDVFGGVDIGLNCVGGGPAGPLIDIEDDAWESGVMINYKSSFLAIKYFGRQMRSQGRGGVILNISSNTSTMCALGTGPYASSKAAVNHMTRVAADEYSPLNIRVVALAPGVIKTPMTKAIRDNPELSKMQLDTVPSSRFGEVEDVANLVLFIASDAGSYVNGETIHIDGGMAARGGWADLANMRGYYEGTADN